jgi:predicted PurR-regulated permease PerM
MSPDQDSKEKERERRVRRRAFHLIFAILALVSGGFLIWKLSSLVLPIIVGALLAFLFRPVKDRFKISWLPHELQVWSCDLTTSIPRIIGPGSFWVT